MLHSPTPFQSHLAGVCLTVLRECERSYAVETVGPARINGQSLPSSPQDAIARHMFVLERLLSSSDVRREVLEVVDPRGTYPSACRNVHAKKSVRPTELALFTHFAVAVPMSNHIIWQGIGRHKRAAVHGKNSLNQQTQKKAPSSWKATGANAKSHGNDNWA